MQVKSTQVRPNTVFLRDGEEPPMTASRHLDILHLDASDADLRLAAAFLRRASRTWSLQGVPVTTSIHAEGTLQGALAALERSRFDAIVVELALPDAQGLETLYHLRNAAPGTPIIVVSGDLRPAEILASIDLGVTDCIPKDGLEPDRLLMALLRAAPEPVEALPRAADRRPHPRAWKRR